MTIICQNGISFTFTMRVVRYARASRLVMGAMLNAMTFAQRWARLRRAILHRGNHGQVVDEGPTGGPLPLLCYYPRSCAYPHLQRQCTGFWP